MNAHTPHIQSGYIYLSERWKMNPVILATLVGVFWGGIAYLATLVINKTEAYAALSGPFIGLLVYYLSRWVYRRKSQLLLIVWSIVSLFAAAAVYGAILGATIYYLEPPSVLGLWQHIENTAIGCAYTIIILFPLWVLLPLAYISHFALKCAEHDQKQKSLLTPAPLPT